MQTKLFFSHEMILFLTGADGKLIIGEPLLSENVKAAELVCSGRTRPPPSLEDELKYSCRFTAATFDYSH